MHCTKCEYELKDDMNFCPKCGTKVVSTILSASSNPNVTITNSNNGIDRRKLDMYIFYPPFFIVNGETNFSDSWEEFCCKLLNLENKTSSIVRRLPPENGVDLFFPDEKIAYQCKSIEMGLTSGFNLTKIKDSYNSALKIKPSLGWDKYVICINIDLTGKQSENFKQELPDVTILTKSYWTSLCNKFPTMVYDDFRRLIPIHPRIVEEKITDGFYPDYSNNLKALLKTNSFDLLFYSNRCNSIYKIPVSKNFKMEDLLHILRGIFKLPQATEFSGGVEFSISYSIVFNDEKVPLNQTIEESGIDENSIITFWLTMTYSLNNEKATATTMQALTTDSMKRTMDPVRYALEDYKALISNSFINADKQLLQT
jgi:hypothetical protein